MATPGHRGGGLRNPIVHWTKAQSSFAFVFDKNGKRVANDGVGCRPLFRFCQKRKRGSSAIEPLPACKVMKIDHLPEV